MNDAGLLLVDKPAGFTSHDVVAKLRRRFGTRRVGHGGTLDPMATGLLIVGLNAATKALQFITDADKEYLATVRLGEVTTTDDAEGEVVSTTLASHLTASEIAQAFGIQTGEIMQVPSSVSAIKQAGVRAYERVRAGEEVILPARPVTISEIAILEIRKVGDFVDVDIRVACSKGTYIRSIARDAGKALAVGGHLTALRRTRIGQISVSSAQSWEEVELLPLAETLESFMPIHALTESEFGALQFGKELHWPAELDQKSAAIGLIDPTRNRVVGIGKPVQRNGQSMIGYHAVLPTEFS